MSTQTVDLPKIQARFFGLNFEQTQAVIQDLSSLVEAGKAPLGQLPSLEAEGKIFCQSGAIARYCGKLAGLYPRHQDLAAAKAGWRRNFKL